MVSPVRGAGGNDFPSGRGTPVQKWRKGVERMPREKFQTLTEQMFYVLLSLREERCGADVMEEVSAVTGGRVTVGPGTLYHLLDQFLHDGMIEEMAGVGRKRSYRLTEKGRRLLEEEYGRLCARVEDYRRWMRKEGEQ